MALLTVMVVILLVSLAAYRFNQRMAGTYRTATAEIERAQARLAAHSGIDLLLKELDLPRAERNLSGARSGLCAGPTMIDADGDMDRDALLSASGEGMAAGWKCAVLSPLSGSRSGTSRGGSLESPRPTDLAAGAPPAWRWGVVNESAKLNLRVLRRWDTEASGAAREALLGLPGADPALVDGLLTAYGLQQPPRAAGRMESIRSRLRSAGGSGLSGRASARRWASLWHGGDWNQDFQLDELEEAIQISGEDFATDAGATPPRSSAGSGEAVVPIAWRDYLTLCSGQRNETRDGVPRVFLNATDLAELRRKLLKRWPVEWANFVIAARQYGLQSVAATNSSNSSSQTLSTWSPDLSVSGAYVLKSPLELIDATVRVPPSGEDEIRLSSPFSSANSERRDYLGKLLDDVTVDPNAVIEGQIDVLTADAVVLSGVPGLSTETAQAIVRGREESPPAGGQRDTLAWLVLEDVIELSTLRSLSRYLTVGGDCYSGQFIGWRDSRSAAYRCTVFLDGRRRPARACGLQQWHQWGRGFALSAILESDSRSME